MHVPIHVVVAGGHGRMGSAVAQAVQQASDLELAGILVEPGQEEEGGKPMVSSDPAALLGGERVLVDFTAPPATGALAAAAAASGAALVSGSTGLGPDDDAALERASARVAVLHAPNMSRGIQLLGELVERAARLLRDYDIEIVERHHRGKADAPSGTALRLLALAGAGRGVESPSARHGRQGHGLRGGADEIGVHALRGGDWVGEHAVILAGPGETVELRHRAESRTVFVAGTLACIRFVAHRAAGRYTMADVLGA